MKNVKGMEFWAGETLDTQSSLMLLIFVTLMSFLKQYKFSYFQGRDLDLSYNSESQTVKKFDTSTSFPPVNLEIIKKQLNTR